MYLYSIYDVGTDFCDLGQGGEHQNKLKKLGWALAKSIDR